MSEARKTRLPNPQAASLGRLVFRLNRAMSTSFNERLAAYGVTGPEWTALSQISRGEVTPVDLAGYMEIDRAAITRILHQLEDKTLIRRYPHPSDGRSTVLALTAGGRRLMPKLVEAGRITNETFLALLDPEDRPALVALLEQLAERLPRRSYAMPRSICVTSQP